MSEKTKIMTEGNPFPILLSFALPLMAGNVFQLMYTFVDTAVVGKYLGVSALAALGSVEYLNWLSFGIIGGLTQGFSIKMAQDFGARNEQSLKKAIGNSIVLSVLSSIVLLIAGFLAAKPILRLMHTPEEILPLSVLYIHILFCGIPASFAYNLFAGLIRSLGNSKTPLHAMIMSSLLNIVLDFVFVLCFHWGIAGAAFATIIAQTAAALFCFIYVIRIPAARFSRNDLKPDFKLCSYLFKLGLPMAIQNSIIAFGGMIVEVIVNSFGVAFIASYVAVTKLYGLLEIAATSFGFALMTYTGQNLGAKKIDRISSGTWIGLVIGLSCSLVISTTMIIFGKQILSMFISGPQELYEQVMQTAYFYLKIMCVCLPLLYILWLTRCVIQGLGNTFIPMVSGIAEFVMRTGSALLLPVFFASTGVLMAEVLAWLGADFILVPGIIYMMHKMHIQYKHEFSEKNN